MMTVGELIAQLQAHPHDLPVLVDGEYGPGFFFGFEPVTGLECISGYRAPASMPFTIGNAKSRPTNLTLEADEPFPCIVIRQEGQS